MKINTKFVYNFIFYYIFARVYIYRVAMMIIGCVVYNSNNNNNNNNTNNKKKKIYKIQYI